MMQVTYKNLETWYEELQENCKGIPTIVVANKIDIDYKVGQSWEQGLAVAQDLVAAPGCGGTAGMGAAEKRACKL